MVTLIRERRMTQLSQFTVVVAICLVTTANTENAPLDGDILFPFGAGDISVSRTDDVFSEVVTPPMAVPFFCQSFTSLFVSTNGLISFGEGTTDYTPDRFPLGIPILAAFWSDVDITTTGSVTYRPYNRTTDTEDLFDRGEAVVRQASSNQFTASWMLIATWYEVPAYGSSDGTITNSFQAVLLTDGVQSFVIYNYKEIRWAATSGGTAAQVGYDAGDFVNYHNVTGALTDDIVNIDERTNIGTRGRWLFRLFTEATDDNQTPVIQGCPDDVILHTTSNNPVPYKWSPPIFCKNFGQSVDVVFGCSATISNECHQDGSGTFSVGDTEVMYHGTYTPGNQNFCNFTITVKEVDIVCPENISVRAAPGFNATRVNWQKPDLTGWSDETIFTSTAVSGDAFPIGSQRVTYQWFGTNGLHLQCFFDVQVVGQCENEVTEDTVLGPLSWPVTTAGLTAGSIERCPLTTTNAGFPRATRNCSTAPPPHFFNWEEHVPQSCGESVKTVNISDVVKVEVTEGNVGEVAEFLVNRTSKNPSSDDDVDTISQILVNIVSAGSGDPEVTDDVIETVANVIMDANKKQDFPDSKSSSAILQSVEAQVSLTLQQEGKVSIQQDSIHVEAVSIDPTEASNGFSFASVQREPESSKSQEGSLKGTEIKTFKNTSEIPKDVVASIQLPTNINDFLPRGNGSLKVSFIVYADDTLFQTGTIKDSDGVKNSTSKVAGSIISLSVEDVILVNLSKPVVLEFKILPNVSEADFDNITCVFWEYGEESGFWSTEGCELAEMTDDKVSCECDHATNFAILVNVKGQKLTHEGFSSTPALDIISQIGGALSVIALAITLVIYLSIRKLRTGKSRQIFIHFCFSLLLLYIVFLAGVDNARGSGGGCVFVGALLHYLTLTTMMWMAVEARNMYVSTIKVFPEDTHLYMIKAGLFAWGSPLIVLTVTLAAATKFYQHGHYCFISPGLAMYLGLLAPIAIILLHNVITFILVMRSLLKVKEASRSEQITKRLQNAVGISALMGLTWCFGFLAIEGATFTFQLLFCLTNSLQGVIVGFMFCARREEVRAALAPYFRRICCGRDCRLPTIHADRSYDLTKVSPSPLTSPSSNQTASLDVSVSAVACDSPAHHAPMTTDVL